jgi:hypothetical protein
MDSFIKRINHYVQVDPSSFDDITRLPFKAEKRYAGQEIVVEGEKIDLAGLSDTGCWKMDGDKF